ncbi:alpha-glucan family phosphorylase [Candidatus Falkowbacteria bacterium]|jgi:starch phosphorylase|nr:alpha-glucan family phosphorylase [Candidatus Falkowbacteria bacterium]
MKNKKLKNNSSVAYFSMEIALENNIKNFAGGLGVLAGDLLRAASELKFPMIGVSLLYKNGYFKQVISKDGEQKERADKSNFSKLKLLSPKIFLQIAQDKVLVRVWEYKLKSNGGIDIPVYLLDTDWPENKDKHRQLCKNLYSADLRKKLKQSIILGRGGIKLLNKLGLENISKIHLNEGHGALAGVELFLNSKKRSDKEKIKEVRKKIVFTTHTPVIAGHNIYFKEFLLKYQPDFPVKIKELIKEDRVNFTNLAMFFSSYINGVSLKHKEVTKGMFPHYKIDSITNGVHSSLWTSASFKHLFDKYITGWAENNEQLIGAKNISLIEIKKAHQEEKKKLIKLVKENSGKVFKENIFTITFARRFAPYKRPSWLLEDIKALKEIKKKAGKIQIVYAGKAHPADVIGKSLILEVNKKIKSLEKEINIAFIPNYDLKKAKILVAGSDLWLNNPIAPNEASATSGMKAAHNGVPQLSTLDGWWLEAERKNRTGWDIIEKKHKNNLYQILAEKIIPLYYKNEQGYYKICRNAITYNASKFNTQRVLREYIKKAYY